MGGGGEAAAGQGEGQVRRELEGPRRQGRVAESVLGQRDQICYSSAAEAVQKLRLTSRPSLPLLHRNLHRNHRSS